MFRVLAFSFAILVVFAAPTVGAHGGGLDSHGCHTDHSTGDYHCHNGGSNEDDYEPRTNTELVLGGVMFSGGAIALSLWGTFTNDDDARNWGAGMGIVGAVASQITQWVLCPIVREESGDDGTTITQVFLGINTVIILWDILVLARVFDDEPVDDALFNLSPDGLNLAMPNLVLSEGGAHASIVSFTW